MRPGPGLACAKFRFGNRLGTPDSLGFDCYIVSTGIAVLREFDWPWVSYAVDDFCSRCQVCSNAYPPDAILPEKTIVRGEAKSYVDFDKCIPFFNENFDCGICIAVCPWSIPGRGPRIVEQLIRRANRKTEQS